VTISFLKQCKIIFNSELSSNCILWKKLSNNMLRTCQFWNENLLSLFWSLYILTIDIPLSSKRLISWCSPHFSTAVNTSCSPACYLIDLLILFFLPSKNETTVKNCITINDMNNYVKQWQCSCVQIEITDWFIYQLKLLLVNPIKSIMSIPSQTWSILSQ